MPRVDDDKAGEPEEDEDEAPPVPPDGGWGWVIMFASFMINFILDGVCFSFGMFYLEFLTYYGASKGKTSWVGSVLNGMYLSMGPIVSALANKFGCRNVTIAGSIIATVAFLLSTLSPNVDVLIFLYGGMGGFGFGLTYLPAIVMVGFYFEKRRALATGVAVCGSGIGAFVFAPLCEKLLSYYHWKGATFIIAGIVLNGVIMGALFRPLEEPRRSTKKRLPLKTRLDDNQCDHVVTNPAGGIKTISQTELTSNGIPSRIRTSSEPCEDENMVQYYKARTDALAQDDQAKYLHSMQNLQLAASPCPEVKCCQSMDDILLAESGGRIRRRGRADELRRPLSRKDIFYSGSIQHLVAYQEDPHHYERSVTRLPDAEPRPGCVGAVCAFFASLKSMMDFTLLKNPVFVVYGASCFLCMAGFYVPFTYLPDHAIERGMTRDQAAFLLSIIGIANTIARVACGWVSDQPWANSLQINNCALIIGGMATIAAPHCGAYGLLATYSTVFGASIAVFVSLRSILMVELIGLDKLTNAFGLVTMCQGLSAFIGAPIAGVLYDWTGNYNISFYSAGISLALAGIICLPLRRVARWQKQREERALKPNKIYRPLEDKSTNGYAANA